MNIKLNDKKRHDIVELFKVGIPTSTIAKLFSVSETTVRSVVNKSGNKYKQQSDLRRKYKLNEDCFGSFETEESLYFFGLLLGDGNISKDRPRVSITLKKSDKEILDKFAKFLKSDRPITSSGTNYRLTIDSVRIYELLLSNYLEPAKSTREKIPKFYNREDVNMRHFWRGLVDADGSLFISAAQKEHLNLISSLDVILEFEAFVKIHTGISMTKVNQHITSKDCYYANYYCRNALIVAELLYGDANSYLDRKFNKYKELMSREERFTNKDRKRYISYIKSLDVYKVYIDTPANYFRNKKRVYLGAFKTEEDARATRDEFLSLMREFQ